MIGVFATEEERKRYLVDRKGTSEPRAQQLLEKDQKEEDDEFGQRTRDTFYRADVFIQREGNAYQSELRRFLDLVFGAPFITPKQDEYAMFLASAAATRSSQPGRQVGAAILNSSGDLVAVGCNDIPKAGGGLYWPEKGASYRDHELNPPCDSNDEAKREISNDIIKNVQACVARGLEEAASHIGKEAFEQVKACMNRTLPHDASFLRGTKLFDITEFGRAVHAEMDALTCCERAGISVKGATLYTTTFPCHNCTRHIIAAGVTRVVYIEPYPKSRAVDLHGDAIRLANFGDTFEPTSTDEEKRKIPFVPFVGIGPRRFFDLFSMELSSGYALERKTGAGLVSWARDKHIGPRVAMVPASYLDREQGAVEEENAALNLAAGGANDEGGQEPK